MLCCSFVKLLYVWGLSTLRYVKSLSLLWVLIDQPESLLVMVSWEESYLHNSLAKH